MFKQWWLRFTHDKLHWHRVNGEIGFDGCSATARCWQCGGRVLQDSQGNWFLSSRQD